MPYPGKNGATWEDLLNSALSNIPIIGPIIGGANQAAAAREASAAQVDAANRGLDIQEQIYSDQMQRSEPFYQAGLSAMEPYLQNVFSGAYDMPNVSFGDATAAGLYGDYQAPQNYQIGPQFQYQGYQQGSPWSMESMQNDPGYQFRLNAGVDALQRSAAGRGKLQSGQTMKELVDYGQGVGSQEAANAFNRYQDQRNFGRDVFTGDRQFDYGNYTNYQNALQQNNQQNWNNQFAYGQDQANRFNTDYNRQQANLSNQANRLASIAGYAPQTAQQTAGYGTTYAQNAGNIYGQIGNAQASGIIGANNAINQNAGNAWNDAMGIGAMIARGGA